jgi:hypothetical protein
MKTAPRRWKVSAIALPLLMVLSGCVATGGGYVEGVYEPAGYEYGGWGPRYHVAPPRGGDRRDEHEGERGGERRPEPAKQSTPHAYRPAPPSRPAPSIPTRPHYSRPHER